MLTDLVPGSREQVRFARLKPVDRGTAVHRLTNFSKVRAVADGRPRGRASGSEDCDANASFLTIVFGSQRNILNKLVFRSGGTYPLRRAGTLAATAVPSRGRHGREPKVGVSANQGRSGRLSPADRIRGGRWVPDPAAASKREERPAVGRAPFTA